MSRPLLVVIVSAASVAHAQPANTKAAELFDQGVELRKDGDYAAACDRFAQSLALDHAAGTELNLGDCHEHLGHIQMAWHWYDAAATDYARTNDKRAGFARGRADALLPQLATIVVKIADPDAAGLVIKIAGRAVTPAGGTITDRVEPGEIVVEAALPGKPPFTRSTKAVAGATVQVDVPSFGGEAARDDHRPGGDDRKPAGAGGSRDRTRVRIAYVVGAGGAALTVTGVVFGLVAKGKYQHEIDVGNCMKTGNVSACNMTGQTNQRSAISLADAGTAIGVIGVVAGAAAAVVYLTAPRDVTVAPAVGTHDVGVSLSARF